MNKSFLIKNKNILFISGIIVISLIIILYIGGQQISDETIKEDAVSDEKTLEKEEPIVTVTQPTVPEPSEVVLIADTENHRIIEVNKENKEIIWQFGCKAVNNLGRCNYGDTSDLLYRPTTAVYLGENILVADYENDRIVEISKKQDIVWSYEVDKSGKFSLNEPNSAMLTKDDTILISDKLNNHVIEINKDKEIVWEYGCDKLTSAQKCAPGKGDNQLNNPTLAVELDNGNILIADVGNNRVLEVTKDKKIAFEYTGLSSPQSAFEISGGTLLISNTNSNQIINTDKDKKLIWSFSDLFHPTFASKYAETILITDSFNNRIIEVSGDEIIWYYGDCDIKEGQPEESCQLGVEGEALFKPNMAVFR